MPIVHLYTPQIAKGVMFPEIYKPISPKWNRGMSSGILKSMKIRHAAICFTHGPTSLASRCIK